MSVNDCPQERYVITGGRSFSNRALVAKVLGCYLNPGDLVVQGGAPGADKLAREWAHANGHPVDTYRADWRFGRGAGPARNRVMLLRSNPKAVIAFPGGRGTADCVRQAKALGITVIEVGPDFKAEEIR